MLNIVGGIRCLSERIECLVILVFFDLMTRDRVQSDTFRLTHKSLAYMLGVRRAGVTEAAGRLQEKNLIRYHHGELTVLDRHGLEQNSCFCYAALNGIYEQQLGKPRVASVQPMTHRVL